MLASQLSFSRAALRRAYWPYLFFSLGPVFIWANFALHCPHAVVRQGISYPDYWVTRNDNNWEAARPTCAKYIKTAERDPKNPITPPTIFCLSYF